MNKIVIGTANFNNIYGVQKSKITKKIINSKILKTLSEYKIKVLDTAFEYNNDKTLFKNYNLKKLKIITKVNLPKKKCKCLSKKF